MAVRAKFKVNKKTEMLGWSGIQNEVMVTVTMNPVTSGSEENKEFYKYTPSGSLDISVMPKSVADFFELGKEYYLDFIRAE
jgi:hypothetical protein